MSTPSNPRRRFLVNAVLATAALPFAARFAVAPAKAADLPRLPLDNPQAKALNYVETTEGLSHASFKPGSNCQNCQFWLAGPKDEWGGCTLFPGHNVAGEGWCSAWAKKAG